VLRIKKVKVTLVTLVTENPGINYIRNLLYSINTNILCNKCNKCNNRKYKEEKSTCYREVVLLHFNCFTKTKV